MTRPFRSTLTIAALLTAAGCREPVGPPRDVAVTVAVGDTVFRPHVAVPITVTVTNRGDRVRTIYVGNCRPVFEVATPTGTVVAPSGVHCLAGPSPRALAPGESFVINSSWRVPAGSAADGGPGIAPGPYEVRARIGATGGVLSSDPVRIRVEAGSTP